MLKAAVTRQTQGDVALGFAASLAQQCFINEYVFSATDGEAADAERLDLQIGVSSAGGSAVSPFALAVLGMYRGLSRCQKLRRWWRGACRR
jgi:hypothetical protein